MSWLKNILIDLVVAVVIILFVTTEWAWARWAVIIYTPFMLVLKLVAIAGGGLMRQFGSKAAAPPAWVFHLLYGINVVALAIGRQWILAAGWLAIWLLSYIQQRR